EVSVYCYWNGCIKYGPEGVYYEGPAPKKIIVNPKIALNRLLDEMYVLTGVDVDKLRSKVKIFGRYPSVVGHSKFQYLLLPVVNNSSLETMLEVPSKHPSVKNVELYLEVKSEGVTGPAACSSKRQKTVKVERGSRTGNIGDAAVDADMTDNISGSNAVAQVVNLAGDGSNIPPLSLSSLWLDDHDLRVGLCFKDADELKKAVDWCSIKGLQKCVVRETQKGECMFECIKWRCKWSFGAAKMEKHGLFEIIKYTGPHTCPPIEPEKSDSEFVADEIERLVRRHPTLSFSELQNWWKANIGYALETWEVRAAKEEAIKRAFGDQSFEDLPKLMSAFQSSNGLLVDWKYDLFPNPKFASFCGVFWAFPQSVQGFQHCRPLILVDTKELSGKNQLNLMIASGVDADNVYLPLAFAVTKQVSSDSWRWFLTNIRKKVTQRKGLCLISSPHPDILSVINEPGSQWKEPWAYHRFCLTHLCSQFSRLFPDHHHHTEYLVMQAGSSTHKAEFDSYIKDIKEKSPEGWKWLDQIPPHQWALAHDSGLRYGVMKIDRKSLFEVCRRSFSKVAMTGGVMLLFSEMKDAFDVSFSCSRGSLHRGDVYTENVMRKFQESLIDSGAYVVTPLERDAFKVSGPSERVSMRHLMEKYKEYKECIVELNDSTCTCGKFQRKRFPCLHALAVFQKMKINPLPYVDDCYFAESYYKTYEATFSPVPEMSAWPEASGVPTLFPPVIAPPPLKVSGKGKGKSKSKEPPSDEELRNAILDILKVMDFKMASFTDIIKQLADKFRYDLTPRKSSIEVMIQYELEKYAADSEEEEDEDEEGLW
ncbi:unnamed protein product, partial [Brassica oleracea]